MSNRPVDYPHTYKDSFTYQDIPGYTVVHPCVWVSHHSHAPKLPGIFPYVHACTQGYPDHPGYSRMVCPCWPLRLSIPCTKVTQTIRDLPGRSVHVHPCVWVSRVPKLPRPSRILPDGLPPMSISIPGTNVTQTIQDLPGWSVDAPVPLHLSIPCTKVTQTIRDPTGWSAHVDPCVWVSRVPKLPRPSGIFPVGLSTSTPASEYPVYQSYPDNPGSFR